MKLKLRKTLVLPLVATVGLLTSCVNNERDLFDAERVKEAYQNSFPVKDIDPNMDWKTTAITYVNITVNEDFGTDYKVQIFDANPLNASNKAKLMGEGYANQEMAFQTTIDCPKALSTVFVARVDKQGRYLVKPVGIENGTITAHFGDSKVVSRAATRADQNSSIPTMEAPYTKEQIKKLLDQATEIKSGWDLSGGAWVDSNEPVFSKPAVETRYFKVTRNFTGNFVSDSSCKVTIIVDTELNAACIGYIGSEVELIITEKGSLKVDGRLQLTSSCRISVLQGGQIRGTGELYFSNGSEGRANYNAGTIDIETLSIDCAGNFFNYGTMNLKSYKASSVNMCLVNRGTINAGEIAGNNNTDIKNGCYMNVTGNLTARNIVLGSNSAIECGSFKHDGSQDLALTLAASSMLNCKGEAMLSRFITGPMEGNALIKIGTLTLENGYNDHSIKGHVICELPEKEQKSTASTGTWSAFDFLLLYLRNGGNTAGYCNVGKANFILPEGTCTGSGYTPENTGDKIDINKQIYTYAFEDNYPNAGDYDFNDIILDVTSQYTRSIPSNQISKIQFNVTLSAVGATKRLGAGLRLVGIAPEAVANIAFEDENAIRSTLTGSMFANSPKESDRAIVIPLFGNAHKVYGIDVDQRIMLNTEKSSIIREPYQLKVILTLADQTKDKPLITSENLDFFIAYANPINSHAKRTEVHLYEFRSNGATENGDTHERNLAVAGKLTWAICVPNFRYPIETTVITTAYPEFRQWAMNGGFNDEFKNWYNNPVEADTEKYIFR